MQIACKNNFANKKILDIGCGVGTLALFLANKSNKVVGIDVSSRAIKIAENARKYLNIENVTFINSELKRLDETFDLVICTEVIEHIANEDEFLKKINSNLSKKGLLLITTPSKSSIFYKIGLLNEFDKDVGHLRRYTFNSIDEVLNKNGFEIIERQKADGLLRMILFTTKLGFIIKFIKGPLVPIFHFFDKLTIYIFGEFDIQVIARKK